MSERRRLPNRRRHEVVEFHHGGFHYRGGVGRSRNGSLAEFGIDAAKIGTAVDAAARDAAIVASLALQFGTPPETIRHATVRDERGRAVGALDALLDLLAEEEAP